MGANRRRLLMRRRPGVANVMLGLVLVVSELNDAMPSTMASRIGNAAAVSVTFAGLVAPTNNQQPTNNKQQTTNKNERDGVFVYEQASTRKRKTQQWPPTPPAEHTSTLNVSPALELEQSLGGYCQQPQ